MKIAFLLTHFPRLSETFVLNQITGLIDRGHEVGIYALERSEEAKIHEDVIKYDLLSMTFHYGEAIRKIPAARKERILRGGALLRDHFLENPRAFLNSVNVFKYKREAASLKIMYRIVPFLGNGDYDILLCHFGPNGSLGTFLKDLGVFRGKVVTVFHGYDMSQHIQKFGRGVYEDLFRKGDLFLPISDRWRNELATMGCPEEKIAVHRMGIDPRKYGYSERKGRAGARIRILSIGRMVEKKGMRFGIEAIRRILPGHPEIEYRIVGDGPLRAEIESSVDRMNLRDRVKLLGWKSQEEILRLMSETDILLAPSVTAADGDQEGIPVVLMEAMAMGIPVVSTRHSGIPELVRDGESGFLAPEGDVEGLVEKLMQCIGHPESWPTLGREGRRIVTREYNIHDLNDRLVSIFRKAIERN